MTSHKHAKDGCTARPEVYDGKHAAGSNGWWFKRCRDCNVEWWSQEEDPYAA